MSLADYRRVTPRELRQAEDDVRRSEAAWKEGGGLRIEANHIREAREQADLIEAEYKEARSANQQAAFEAARFATSRFIVKLGLDNLGFSTSLVICGAALFAVSLVGAVLFSHQVGTVLLTSFLVAFPLTGLVAILLAWVWPFEERIRRDADVRQFRIDALEKLEAIKIQRDKKWQNYQAIKRNALLLQEYKAAYDHRQRIDKLLKDIKYLLLNMDWRSLRGVAFEEFLVRVFESLGYDAKMTKASGDQGVDLIVTGKGMKIAVQAKGYGGSVGNHSVQEVHAGKDFYACGSCAVVTNSVFTSGARKLAEKVGCRLIDGSAVADLILGRIF